MKILVQTNRRNESQLTREFQKLSESGFEVIPFGYIERYASSIASTFGSDRKEIVFTGLEDIDPNEPILARTGIRLIKSLKVDNIPANIDLSKTIDYDSKVFETPNIPESLAFLNKHPGDYFFTSFLNIADVKFDTNVFIKPFNDLKGFEGFIIPKGTTVREYYSNKNSDFLTENMSLPIHVSSNVRTINEEVRCYVVNKKVVTVSRYRFRGQPNINPLPPGREKEYIAYAQRVINAIYAPCDNFTIDICLVDEQNFFQVVEYNCLTASGLYGCNTKILFNALKEYYYG